VTRFLCAVLLAAGAGAAAAQMTPEETFGEGKGFGASGAPSVGSNITSGTGASTVPLYSTTQPQSSLFAGGDGSLAVPGTQQVTDCQTMPPGPDGRAQQQCEATNFLAKKSSAASFNLAPTDPVLVKARPITNDPQSILGAMSGTYSACTPQTTTVPTRKQIEVCTESRAPEKQTCQKVLAVKVTSIQSCTPGTWFGGTTMGQYPWAINVQAYCQMSGPVGLYVHDPIPWIGGGISGVFWVDPTTGMTAPQTISNISGNIFAFALGYYKTIWYQGGSCTADACSFTFDVFALGATCPGGVSWCQGNIARAVFTFPRPRSTYTESDQWDNQCATLEARLP
jgi:hypothetical protein